MFCFCCVIRFVWVVFNGVVFLLVVVWIYWRLLLCRLLVSDWFGLVLVLFMLGMTLFAVFVCWRLCCCVCAGVRLV